MSMSTARMGLLQRKPATSQSTPVVVVSKEEEVKYHDRAKPAAVLRKSPSTPASSSNNHHHDGHVLIPLAQKSLLRRHDVGPFLVLYLLLMALDHVENDTSVALKFIKLFGFPLVLISHLALVLAQQWRVSIQSRVGYSIVSSFPKKAWTHCWVQAPAVGGRAHAEICPVVLEENVAKVTFQNVVFRAALHGTIDPMDHLFGSANQQSRQDSSLSMPKFCRLVFPDHLALDFYKNWSGHVTLQSSSLCQDVYGNNTTSIQLPPFSHLLGEQLLAPFFMFQLLCVALWSLDEYWYYAIFTLLALVMFEGTVAYNRLKSLQRLRGTLRHPYHVYVYRHGEWMLIQTTELLPGDVVSLSCGTLPKQHGRARHQEQHQERHVPADVLLLKGTVVVDEALLTGESVPQLKGPLDTTVKSMDLTNLDVQDSQHKQSVLFGGTVLVSHDCKDSSSCMAVPNPPNGGVVGFVLRTGFETAQGSLLRTMAHSSSNQSVDGLYNRDTFVFVSLLLLCAVVSAASVLREGWHDETRNKFRLLLHVVIIITSVVPPELPMELSLAVTNSVADLMRRCNVYCTEPYRIPWAGRVNVCCFDKTGTLTSDEMQLYGVQTFKEGTATDLVLACSSQQQEKEMNVPWPVMRIMAACHSLAMGVGKGSDSLMGDPLEKAVLQATPYRLVRNGLVAYTGQVPPSSTSPKTISIRHRFAFSSRLKRMTVLVTESVVENSDSQDIWALSKGAPETLKTFLAKDSIPSDYDELFTHHMNLGQRVLAIGYRHLGKEKSVAEWKEEGRQAVETDLMFAGFLVLDCPLKPDSKQVISELRKSGHGVVMITGDAVLTAAEVARQVGIIRVEKGKAHTTYELRERSIPDSGESADLMSRFAFFPLSTKLGSTDDEIISLAPSNLKHLRDMSSRREASFCVSGQVLQKVAITAIRNRHLESGLEDSSVDEKNVLFHPAAQSLLKDLVPMLSVFARHAPRQKEAVVAALNLAGFHTLMCGDGTNDVGALKRAHVGISIISAPNVEAKQREATAVVAKVKAEQKREKKKGSKKKGITMSKKKARSAILEESLRQLREAQEELDFVELGDASVASPFTSRAVSIKCCKDVLQQGRCTLVTMLQIYKILGVNCLVNALVLTELHMHGVKQGDRQLTILGIAVAMLFLFVTRGKPLPTLSPRRPPSSVLCLQALISIGVQFLVHAASILAATQISLAYVDPWDPSIIPDGSFNPNVLNSCTFLLTVLATVNTFVVNYRGRPFMEDLRQNATLVRSVQFCYAVLFVCALEVFPPLNDLLQLAPLPDSSTIFLHETGDVVASSIENGVLHGFVGAMGFPVAMCALMVVDTALAYVAEKCITRVFEG